MIFFFNEHFLENNLIERERERERSMGRGETRANDDDGVRKEKAKGKEKKWERVRRCQKILFPAITDENNIYKR